MDNNLVLNISVFLVLIISLIIGYSIVPRIVLISKKKGLFDFVNERKSHTDQVSRLGGVSFFPAILFSISFVVALRYCINLPIAENIASTVLVEMLFLMCGSICLYFIGMADDLVGVSYKYKLAAQVLAVNLMMASGVYLNNLHGFLGINAIPFYISYPLTLIISIFIINSINLIDGVDGLASGLSSVALVSLGSWYLFKDLYIYAMIAFGMIGVIIPFFYFNVFSKRIKIFMGDTGSLLLGFIIAFLSVKFCMLTISEPFYRFADAPIFILAILFIPIFDAFRVFAERMLQGKSPFFPDKSHIHHKFLALGFSHRQTMTTIVAIAVAFAILNTILVRYLNINVMFFIDISLGFFMIYVLHRIKESREESLEKYNEELVEVPDINLEGNKVRKKEFEVIG